MDQSLNAKQGLTWFRLGNPLIGIPGRRTGVSILRPDFNLKISDPVATPSVPTDPKGVAADQKAHR